MARGHDDESDCVCTTVHTNIKVDFWLVVERFRTLDAEGDEFKKQVCGAGCSSLCSCHLRTTRSSWQVRSIFLQYIEPPQILKMVTNAERIELGDDCCVLTVPK